MERLITKDLLKWKSDPKRKPLILQGMRQCGKTWVLKEFGTTQYRNLAYVSFDKNPEYGDFFARSREPLRIIENLAIALRQPIDPDKTLLVFDEIQECPDALASIKYFQEEQPAYHVACAGSLLGIRLKSGGSFPVGKADFLEMFPLTLSEYLMACGDGPLLGHINGLDAIEGLPEPFRNLLYDRLKQYFTTGGMPEAVAEWLDRRDTDKLERVLTSILNAYQYDFSEHLDSSMLQKVSAIWQSLPAQLSKENKKFKYNMMKDGASSRDYGEALVWLTDARLAYRVARVNAPGLPVSAYEDPAAFKLYAADVGLLRSLSDLDMGVFAQGSTLLTGFKGALTENFVLQSLAATTGKPLRYWSITNPNNEVDFIMQSGMHVIPIEVKAGAVSKGRGLGAYKRRYPNQTTLRIRYSLLNLDLTDDLLNIPLYLVDQTPRLIELALATLR
jgi:predicted AAA+ superfamily ATPase